MKLSIIIPFYNEQKTLAALLEKVHAVELESPWEKEIILVDDGKIAQSDVRSNPDRTRLISLPKNQGKGSATREGLQSATGTICLIQDADLEYDPEDYKTILSAYRDPEVHVVYGSRILGSQNRFSWTYYWGGRCVSFATNVLFDCQLTDEPTCYKSFRRAVLDDIELVSNGFEFCPEITGKLIRAGYTIAEVPIHYYPRSFEEGKKIRARDGIIAIWTLFRVRFGIGK